MNTKQAAEKWNRQNPGRKPPWNSKIVSDYCNDGMVIDQEKINGKWFIPDDAPEPLLGKWRAATLLERIVDIHEGADPIFIDPTHTIDQYDYISALGYCSKIDWHKHRAGYDSIDLRTILLTVTVTSDGKRIINEVNEERRIRSGKSTSESVKTKHLSFQKQKTESTSSFKG